MKKDMSQKEEYPVGEGSQNQTYLRLQQSQLIRHNIHAMSQLLNTGLSPDTLDICIKLIEAGVHPKSLAEVVIQIRRELAELEKTE